VSEDPRLNRRYTEEEYEDIKSQMLEYDRLATERKLLSKETRDYYRARKEQLSDLLATIEQRGLEQFPVALEG
jgi:hypothetical protein